jgi:predicted aspartyl protease
MLFLLSALVFAGGDMRAFADPNCQLTRYASLDMGTDPAGGVYVPVAINGHSENLLVDTGGLLSMLTQSTVQNLSLATEPISSRMIVYLPGARITKFVHADTIQLGNMKADHIVFFLMPDGRLPSEEGGTLAPDFMANYDVEFDFANAKFNLFSPQHCPGQVVYWTHQPYAQIPFQIDREGHIVAAIQLDGKSIDATIDTGTSRSIMGFESAYDLFGWDDKTAGLTVFSKRSNGTPASYRFPFKSLSMSGVSVNNPDILLVRLLSSGDFRVRPPKRPFLLGMGILRQLHVYISYKEKTIYVTPAEAH